jgi:Fur family transcriptional regulator, iron response regulator
MIDRDRIAELLRARDIQLSAQRLAIAAYVLESTDHPTADQVHRAVTSSLPMVSRATVYNTLKLLVERGLLSQHHVDEGPALHDPNVHHHHHLIDEDTGRVIDIPADAIEVARLDAPAGYEVLSYTVTVRGRRRDGEPETPRSATDDDVRGG